MPDTPAPTLPATLIAMALAALAGATDVVGLSRLHDIFVSFMSGNTTLLGVAIGRGDWPRAGLIAGVIALFVAGAVLGTLVAARGGRFHAAWVLALVAALLGVPLVFDRAAVPALVLAMGALNATMARLGSASIGLTYVTGALVKLGQGLGHRLVGSAAPDAFWLQGLLWASLLAGAVGAAFAEAHGGPLTASRAWPLPLAAALLVPALAWQARGDRAPRR